MWGYIWPIVKLMLIAAFAVVIHLVWKLLAVPYLERRRQKDVPNLYMTKKFYPLVGDISYCLEYVRTNKYHFYEHMRVAMEEKICDIKLFNRGSDIRYYIVS